MKLKNILNKIKALFGKWQKKDPFEASQYIPKKGLQIPFKSYFSKIDGPPLVKWYPHILSAIVGVTAADVAVTYSRSKLLPSKAISQKTQPQPHTTQFALREDYQSIIKRNIFNSDGKIPPPLATGATEEKDSLDGPAVPSNLPLGLVGTIVHVNPAKSVATIHIRQGEQKIIPFMPNDDIEGLAKLLKVERRKAIIRNSNTRRLEYIEIKEENTIKFGFTKPQPDTNEEVQREGNSFSIKRSDLQKYTANLTDVLQQAAAIPYRDPQTGEITGFRVLNMKEGSIFGQLGILRGDIISKVNGVTVNSPKKAMDLYLGLKDSNGIEINVIRNNREETLNYTITE